MKWRNFCDADLPALCTFWNEAAPLEGYAPLTREQLCALVTKNPYFEMRFAFVLERDGALCGFACGAANARLAGGAQRGYVSCVLTTQGGAGGALLLDALENAFSRAGCETAEVLFFNPIRLPWLIPNTPGHTHNNVPGMWTQSPLHGQMLLRGYVERARECAMYLRLGAFCVPQRLCEKQASLAQAGYEICFYDKARHTALLQALQTLGNPEWEAEISDCAAREVPFLVAAQQGRVVGFAGPVYPEAGGRGYFTGIGVVPESEGRGLGTLLFYRLCEAEQALGAQYMSLFTGEQNPARGIYERAGFAVVRTFGILRKALTSQ